MVEIFFFLKNLLAYNNCKGDTLWYLHMCLQYILVRFIPSIILPLPLSPFLEQFQQVSFFCFHIWIQNTCTILTLIHFLLPIPSHWYSIPEKFYFTLLPFILLSICWYFKRVSPWYFSPVYIVLYLFLFFISMLHAP
jgi:hypothetical protein